MDFTANMYKEILVALKNNGYSFLLIKDFIASDKLPERYVLIRHDVDLDPFIQLEFAEMEAEMNIFTSYYFRYIDKIFKKDIISKIYTLGHEIGYHYEVNTKAQGDSKLALELFQEELREFQSNWNTQTICPHGGSFNPDFNAYGLGAIIKNLPVFLFKRKELYSNWSNFSICRNQNFTDFNLLGDAYDSIDFSEILYLSDTGRSWGKKHKRLDRVQLRINKEVDIKSSKHLIQMIEAGYYPHIYLLIHLEQWKDNFKDWLGWYLAQLIRRKGKRIIFGKDRIN